MSDVATRLSRGAAAVGTTAAYVAACQAVGRTPRGLTPEVVEQAYFAEEGLDLAALDDDAAVLLSAAERAADALSWQRQALDGLSDGWRGESGVAATGFVTRQCAAAAQLLAALQHAAEILVRLRRTLAALVDEKVDATIRIDDRAAAQRGVWVAAADTVRRGVADDSAVAVVCGQIAPYVDTDIGAEWLPAMRAGSDRVSAAYRTAGEQLGALGWPPFEIAAPPVVAVTAPVRAAPTPPAAATVSPTGPAPPPTTMPAAGGYDAAVAPLAGGPAAALAPNVPFAPPAPAPPVPVSPGDRGGPDVTTSVRRLRRRGKPAEAEETAQSEEPQQPEEPAVIPEAVPQNETPAAPAPPMPAPSAPAPLAPQPDPPPPLAAEAPAPPRSPCEIAADELPQVGQ